ncbi:porphobilinogen deaminase, dipyromethane cofactor binding domain-containing protein [Lasiosphaeris hirsuta]|uniref:Porphobilinogen deaminase n=1 Tax=Lasiosphaeris hirsuta TaxID=260670 RepID=A0AA40AR89_9PEZI|nr:porphobilinogen deaminase, dipyromethane cofactor binding domain-containing protein [Lasiosphaeris hirsuta]
MASPALSAQVVDAPATAPAVIGEEEPFTIRVGTRRSALALRQVEMVIATLKAAHPHVSFEVHAMKTAGDVDKVTPLPEMGKGLWTNELEAKLGAHEIDMVVHCLKDMPTSMPDGMVLGCVTAREDPRDVVVFKAGHEGRYKTLADLPEGAVVGTSSVRRAAQLRRRYPGLAFRDVRGNIDTRLKKVDTEAYDCIILAAAGLHRMDFHDRIAQYLDSTTEGGGMLHAVGQGALGLEVRDGDERALKILKSIEDRPTMMACYAERSVMRMLEGGCSVPIGVETAWVDGEDEADGDETTKKLRIRAVVVSLDGQEGVEAERAEEVASLAQADSLGKRVAQELAEKGAQRILDVINAKRGESTGAIKVSDTAFVAA